MTTSNRWWVAAAAVALGCGGRTTLGVVVDGGAGTDASAGDGPIVTFDGGVFDGPIAVDSSPPPFDGFPPPTSDVVVPPPFDAFPPPFDGYPPPYYDAYPPPPSYDAYPPPYYDGSPPPYFDGYPPPYYDAYPPPFDVSPPPLDGGPPADGPVTMDGGVPDATILDAGDGGAPLVCGGSVCSAGDQCCVTFGGGTPVETCVMPGGCDAGAVLTCTGSNNCSGGDVCCGTVGGGTGGASCAPSCGPGTVQLCGDGVCPPGLTCFTSPFGLAVCGP